MTAGRMAHLLHVAQMVYDCAEVLSWCAVPETCAEMQRRLRLRTQAFLEMMRMEEINRKV